MKNLILSTALGAMILGSSPAFAQETQPAAPQADAAATESAAPADSAAQTETPAEPQEGDLYIAETIDAWEMQCVKSKEGTDPCQMYQLLKGAEGNAIAEVSLFRLPEGSQAVAGATVIVPLETLLAQPLRIAVDAAEGKVYPYTFCNQIGCFARVGFTAEDITAFKKGNEAKITLRPFGSETDVVISMSLKGFTASYNKTSVMQP